MSLDVAIYRELLDAPPRARPVPRARWYRRAAGQGLLLVACLGLGGYDAIRLYHNLTAVTPQVAYLDTDVGHVVTPSSGRLAFLADAGTVAAGEPVLAIQVPSGKTLVVEADADESVVARDSVLGTHVNRGDPILSVATSKPRLYLHAVLSRAEAFDVARGSTAHFETLGPDAKLVRTLAIAPNEVSLTPIPPARPGADPMFDVKLPIDAGDQQFSATPVDLEFDIAVGERVRRMIEGLGLPAAFADTVATWFGSAAAQPESPP